MYHGFLIAVLDAWASNFWQAILQLVAQQLTTARTLLTLHRAPYHSVELRWPPRTECQSSCPTASQLEHRLHHGMP